MLHTRRADLGDIEQLAPLFDTYRQFYDQPPDIGLATRFLRDRLERGESVVLLAEDEARSAIGFCQLYPSFCSVEAQPIYVLYDLFVAPAARRTGAGRLLLQTAERLAAETGHARMDLSTARTNLRAQALYESLGWVKDEEFFVYSRRIVA